jgi:hypothetical protein
VSPLSPRLIFDDIFEHLLFNLLCRPPLSINRPVIHIAVRIMKPGLILEIQLQQRLRVIDGYVHRLGLQHSDIVPQRGDCAAVRARDANPVLREGRVFQHEVFGEKVGTAARMVQSIVVVVCQDGGLVGAQVVLLVDFI